MLPQSLENWAREAAPAFRRAGAAPGWDRDAARLYVALWARGLNPRITSLYRDPAKQREMRARWDRGDRTGLRARPADPDTSLHCKTSFFGGPRAMAMDVVTSNDKAAAQVASELGIGSGLSFRTPDPGHFFSLRG